MGKSIPKPTPEAVPYDVEAEEAVLGSCLMDSRAIVQVMNFLQPSDFFRETNRAVYEAILALESRKAAIDFLTVRAELERQGRLDFVGGPSFLTRFLNAVPTSLHVEHYGRVVSRAAHRRRGIQAASQIAELWYNLDLDEGEIANRTEKIQRDVTRPVQVGDGFKSSSDLVTRFYDQLTNDEPPVLPVLTGLQELDERMHGLYPKQMTVVAARPGMGKSSLLLGWMHTIATAGFGVVYQGLEMSEEDIMRRRVQMLTGIPFHRLSIKARDMREDERRLLFGEGDDRPGALARIEKMPAWADSTRGLSASEICRRVRQVCSDHPVKVVIVDYLQLVQPDEAKARRDLEVSDAAQKLYTLADELGVHIVIASQLNRAVESRNDRKPILSDLRESGDIEQTVDNAVFPWRSSYYLDGKDKSADELPVEIAELHCLKLRHGKAPAVEHAGFWGDRALFVSMSRVDALNNQLRRSKVATPAN